MTVTESFTLTAVIPATPLRVYQAWLDDREHAAFTGAKAQAEPGIGGAFTARDGYIRGRNLELSEGRRILQSWRTTEFPPGSEDSLLEILLEEASGGTRLTLRHSGIPEGQGASYETGWADHYFGPLRRYFGKAARSGAASRKGSGRKATGKPARRRAAGKPAARRRKPTRRPKSSARPRKAEKRKAAPRRRSRR